jgi:hypothetical protein
MTFLIKSMTATYNNFVRERIRSECLQAGAGSLSCRTGARQGWWRLMDRYVVPGLVLSRTRIMRCLSSAKEDSHTLKGSVASNGSGTDQRRPSALSSYTGWESADGSKASETSHHSD